MLAPNITKGSYWCTTSQYMSKKQGRDTATYGLRGEVWSEWNSFLSVILSEIPSTQYPPRHTAFQWHLHWAESQGTYSSSASLCRQSFGQHPYQKFMESGHSSMEVDSMQCKRWNTRTSDFQKLSEQLVSNKSISVHSRKINWMKTGWFRFLKEKPSSFLCKERLKWTLPVPLQHDDVNAITTCSNYRW